MKAVRALKARDSKAPERKPREGVLQPTSKLLATTVPAKIRFLSEEADVLIP